MLSCLHQLRFFPVSAKAVVLKLIENKNPLSNQNLTEDKDASSIIKNIKYLSFDSVGNKYEVNAKTGQIKDYNSEIIYMKNV